MEEDRPRQTQVQVVCDGEPSGDEVAQLVRDVLAIARGEATDALSKAAGNEPEWRKAFSSPLAYLESLGIALQDGVQLSLIERPTKTPRMPAPLEHRDAHSRGDSPSEIGTADFPMLRAMCDRWGGQLIFKTSCKKVEKKGMDYWKCFRDPSTGAFTCVLTHITLEWTLECGGEWVCVSP